MLRPLLCGLTLSALASAQSATFPGSGWKLDDIDLDLELDVKTGQLRGRAHMRLRLASERAREIGLGVNSRNPLMRFTGVEAPEGATTELNSAIPGSKVGRLALVKLAKPAAKGDVVELRVEWRSSGQGAQFAVTRAAAIASWVEGWHPIPVPRSRGGFSKQLKAPGTTRFRLPPGWHVLSNGTLVSSEATSDGVVETWKVKEPVARSFAAGPYEVARKKVGEREVGVYLLSPKPTSAAGQVKALGAALSALEARFGPYPYASYGIAEVPTRIGGFFASSEQGFIMCKPGVFVVEGGNIPLFGHESGHAWWGNLVGSEGQGSIVCNETLAQYCALIAIEAIEGDEAVTEFLDFSRTAYPRVQCARGYFGMLRAGQDKPLSQLTSGQPDHDLSDAKGHWVFHMLRRRIGEDRFFATFKKIIADYQHKKLSLPALRREFIAAAPDAGLEKFFEQWFDRKGAPVLSLEWKPVPDKRKIEVVVVQEQAGEAYDLQLDLEVEAASGKKRMHRVELTDRRTKAELAIDSEVRAVEMDPRHALLIWRPEYGKKPAKPDK